MSGDPDDFSSMIDYDHSVGLVTAFSTNLSTTETFEIVESSQSYIDKIIDMRLSAGQLSECPLTMAELTRIKKLSGLL
jgi:predicted amino acid-binding ACT domain protein